jgi:methyl-accepting chemotaxis protein
MAMRSITLKDLNVSLDKGEYDILVDESSAKVFCRDYVGLLNALLARCHELSQRSRTMMEQNPMPILLLDQDFRILDANDAYQQMSGISHERILTMTAREFKLKEQKGEGLKDVVRYKRRSFGEISLDLPSGAKVLEQYGIPILDSHGDLAQILVVYNDVTELRARMKDIVNSQKRSDSIIQENPYPILIVDPAMAIVGHNKAFSDLTGYDRERLQNLSLRDFTYIKSTGGRLEDTLKNKEKTRGTAVIDFPSGRRTVRWHYIPLMDDGNVAHVLVVYRDITDEQKSLDEIKGLQQRSAAIVEGNPYPIVLVDPSMAIQSVNRAFLETAGYSKDQAISLSLKDFRYKKSSGGKMEDVLRKKEEARGVSTIEFPAGTRVLEWHYIPLLDSKGSVANILIVYNDITEKRVLEERLENSIAELARSLASVAAGDFTSAAATYKDDPLGKVKGDLNATLVTLQNMLKEVMDQANQLEHAIIDVGHGTDEIARATQQVALTAQKTTDEVRTQIAELEKVTKEVSDLSASNEEIASTSQEVKAVTLNVAKQGNEAAKVGNDASAKMQIVQEISQRAVDEITLLNNKMHEISNIVKLITDIANQTNLLALNAAIEAARAGEHGRGFAVVAGEVRNLAGESKEATRSIEDVINDITQTSENTSVAMRKAYEEIIAGIASVNATIEALNRMVSDVNISANSIADISRATEDQAHATNNVTKNIDSINNLILGAEKRMDDLAALAQESSASTEEVASAANEIKAMAEHLREMVGRFRVS